MLGAPDRAWGKLRPAFTKSREVEWHPLVDHCADVAACIEGLLLNSTIADRLGLDPDDETRIARLVALAFLHDLGKANWGFQNKQYRLADGTYPRGIGSAGHVRELTGLFCGDGLAAALEVALPLTDILGWGRETTVCGLLAASFSHHGTPFNPFASDPDARNRFPRLWQPSPEGYDPFSAITDLGAAVRRWLPAAFAPAGAPLADDPRFQHAFAGLVMLADWLGSDEAFFPYTCDGDGERMPFVRERAAAALRAIGIDVAAKRTYVAAHPPAFCRVFPQIAEPNPMQTAAARLDTGRLVVLEAETGSGKTEAALWRFVQLFRDGAVDGLYFALPTRIAATQIHERVQRAVSNIFAADDRPAVLLMAALFGLFPFLRKLYADGGYQGPVFQTALARVLRHIDVEIVKRSDRARGFEVLPKRWIVERTIGWLNRCRRLAKDWENLNRKALAFLRLASIRLMLRRICNP